jgi:transposase-like protein
MKSPPDPHYRHRSPTEIISHAVWLYHVFSLSLPDVELLFAERGIVLSSSRGSLMVTRFVDEAPALYHLIQIDRCKSQRTLESK